MLYYHKHFPISDDESLVELNDFDRRISLTRPVKTAARDGSDVAIAFRFTPVDSNDSNSLRLVALEHAPREDTEGAQEISEEDSACLAELCQTLRTHNRVHRFGITVLHWDPLLEDGEVLLETCDVENRVLTTKPIQKIEEVGTISIETNWRFDVERAGECFSRCTKICHKLGPSRSVNGQIVMGHDPDHRKDH